MNRNWVPALAFCTAVCFSSAPTAAPRYVSSVIEPEADIYNFNRGDLNGDGLGDLLLATWSEQRGRELLVYLQEAGGQFPGKPSQRIDIKKDIIAYGLADLRQEAGEELLFFTRSGVYSYSSRKESYADNLRKLFDWELLVTVPQKKSLPFVGRLQDYNLDGHEDLLLPGQERYGLFYGGNKAGFRDPALFPEPHRDPRQNAGNNVGFNISQETGLTFTVDRASVFDGLFSEPSSDNPDQSGWDRFGLGGSILDVESWLASVHPARMNGDELADFVFLDHSEDNPGQEVLRFNVLYQTPQGVNSSEPDWRQQLGPSDYIAVNDVNGDGLDDVVAVESKGSDEYSLVFFLNRNGKFNFSKVDQAMRFSGYEVEAELHDLNGDNSPELIVSYYGLAAVDALRSGSMLRTTLIYSGMPLNDIAGTESPGDALIFARRPSEKMEDKFSASSVKGLTERLHFSADLNGDGRKEVVGLDDKGALVARSISNDLQIDDEPLWRFVPLHLIQSVVPEILNGDGSTDFLIQHQNAVTLLVSRS